MAVTADQVLANCIASGTPRPDCERAVAGQMVDGVYCDGNVIMTAGEPPRCIPSGVIEAKLAAQKADCLAHCGEARPPKIVQQCVPWCGGGTAFDSNAAASEDVLKKALVVGSVVVGAVAIYMLLRD